MGTSVDFSASGSAPINMTRPRDEPLATAVTSLQVRPAANLGQRAAGAAADPRPVQ
jgi:hypothetical protein